MFKHYIPATIFIAGLMGSSTALSQQELIPSETLNTIVKNTAREIVLQQQAAEDRELAKLPDVLECDTMKWMSSCYAINKQAKKNPQAPIRVNTKNGVEFNFPPGTPSTVIRMILDGSPDAARAFIDEYDKKFGLYNRAASASQDEIWRIGGIKNTSDIHESEESRKKPLPINTDNVEAFLFVESSCSACDRQLKNLQNLKEKYPKLQITIYQLDQNKKAFQSKVIDRGLSGRILSREDSIKVQKKGVRSWPTMWLDNNKLKARAVYRGIYNMSYLEDLFLAASKREVK